ncbi:hypothetical protein AB0A77_20975 [Streptomyces varsoviensis]|uniref:hypothetical protein n=1 Tax=Streptomyces varsoviensis TaxID=67373 RepID=UPI00340E3C47
MAEQTEKQTPYQFAKLGEDSPFHPRLGDLASDLAQGGRIGIVISLPDEASASYHLRPPAGGQDWSAWYDGATLRRVPVPVTHVAPMARDVIYDRRARRAALPIVVHHEDGSASESVLILTPAQVELYSIQFERLIELRKNTT